MTDTPAPAAIGSYLDGVLGSAWLELGAGLARARLTATTASVIELADSDGALFRCTQLLLYPKA